MKTFLKKIGLVDYLTTELKVNQNTFISRLKENVDSHSNGLFDIFNNDNNRKEYQGTVSYNEFDIRRREFSRYQNQMQASIKGKIYQKGEQLVIESEISGYTPWMIVIFGFLLVFYCIFLFAFIFSAGNDFGNEAFFIIPFIAIHASVMFYLPYKMLKRAVQKSKYDMEREFFYLAR